MKQLLTLFIILLSFRATAQKIFFTSAQTYTREQLEKLYASIAVQTNLLLFNAPDYNLYGYDVNTGKQKWVYRLGRKSTVPPFFVQDFILVNNREGKVIQLDTAAGHLIKTLPFFDVQTQPVVRKGVLYTTGIYDAGSILAYDLKTDSVIWSRFIAHGYEQKPYYHESEIWVNGESDTWFEMNYDGGLIGKGCDSTLPDFPWNASCSEKFVAMTHDKKRIEGGLMRKLGLTESSSVQVAHSARNTFVLQDETLIVLGNRLKVKVKVPLYELLPDSVQTNAFNTQGIIKADDEKVWLLYNRQLVIYHHLQKKLVKMYDLQDFNPLQPILQDNRLWFVAQKDGLLYGMVLD